MLNLKKTLTKLLNGFYFKSGAISGTSMQILPTGMEIRTGDSTITYWINDSLLICTILISINANNTAGNITVRMPCPDNFPTIIFANNGAIRTYRKRTDYPEFLPGDSVNLSVQSNGSSRYIELYERNFMSSHSACQYIQITGNFVIPYRNMP